MKIIHTSDWHIGQTLYQYSRDEEHVYFFNQLKDIILYEKPDALLVSGDVFHSATPTVQSQKLYYHTLYELSHICDDMQIILTAGNHDSPSRLEAPRELWAAFNVSVIGSLDFYRDAKVNENDLAYDASKLEIPIKRNDEIIGWVLAVPFVNAGNYPSLKENDNYSNRVFSFYKTLKEHLKSNSQYKDNHSIIAMGHFMINGLDNKMHDKIIGGIESVDSDKMSSLSDIDYWALGHVHRPQNINISTKMRYCGSPFALTFNEIYQHSVTIVEIDDHKTEIRIRELQPMISISDFPNKPASFEEALNIDAVLKMLPQIIDNESYVRLHIGSDLPLSDVENAKIIESFRDKKAKFCGVQLYLPTNELSDSRDAIKSIEDFKKISPFELGCNVYKKRNNAEMPDEMKSLFEEVCKDVLMLND